MNTTYTELKRFLTNTDDIEPLLNSQSTIWIDWKEDDEAVIYYINQHLEEESQMGHFVDTDEDADVNIVLMNTKEKGVLPIKTRTIFNPESRDTTLKGILMEV